MRAIIVSIVFLVAFASADLTPEEQEVIKKYAADVAADLAVQANFVKAQFSDLADLAYGENGLKGSNCEKLLRDSKQKMSEKIELTFGSVSNKLKGISELGSSILEQNILETVNASINNGDLQNDIAKLFADFNDELNDDLDKLKSDLRTCAPQ